MSDEIKITTKLCQSQTGVSCNEVVLKIPQTEVVKLQSVAFSINGNQNFSAQDFIHHVDSNTRTLPQYSAVKLVIFLFFLARFLGIHYYLELILYSLYLHNQL